MKLNWPIIQGLVGLAVLGIGLWLMSPGWALVVVGGILTIDALLKRARKGGD